MCVCACTSVRMHYLCTYVSLYYLRMCVCMYVCMYICVLVHAQVFFVIVVLLFPCRVLWGTSARLMACPRQKNVKMARYRVLASPFVLHIPQVPPSLLPKHYCSNAHSCALLCNLFVFIIIIINNIIIMVVIVVWWWWWWW